MADFSKIKEDTKNRMDKTLETLKTDFASLRAGRAHVSLLDGIMVEAYGSMTPLSQVGTISVPERLTLCEVIRDEKVAVRTPCPGPGRGAFCLSGQIGVLPLWPGGFFRWEQDCADSGI